MENKIDKEKMKKIELIVAASIIAIIAIFVIVRAVQYQKEGEKNMPYNISKIIVIGTANKYEKPEPQENPAEENSEENSEDNSEENSEQNQAESEPAEDSNATWNFDIIQTNDVYISIEKIEENIRKDEKIKSITIENIKVVEAPQNGTLKAYMPNSLDGEQYNYTNDYIISNKLTYKAGDENNFKDLQVASNGGIIGLSFANADVGKYVSGEETEINYNGTLLAKLGLTDESLKSKVSFDLIIELDNGKKYTGNVVLELNCEGLIENGTSQSEIKDFNNVIFKRIK